MVETLIYIDYVWVSVEHYTSGYTHKTNLQTKTNYSITLISKASNSKKKNSYNIFLANKTEVFKHTITTYFCFQKQVVA